MHDCSCTQTQELQLEQDEQPRYQVSDIVILVLSDISTMSTSRGAEWQLYKTAKNDLDFGQNALL